MTTTKKILDMRHRLIGQKGTITSEKQNGHTHTRTSFLFLK